MASKLWRAGKRGQRSRHTLDAPALEHVPARQEVHVVDPPAHTNPGRVWCVRLSMRHTRHAGRHEERQQCSHGHPPVTRVAAPPPRCPMYLSPSLSRSRSRSVRAHSLAGNTQHASDCALFLSLARPRSFARARALTLSLSLSLSPHTQAHTKRFTHTHTHTHIHIHTYTQTHNHAPPHLTRARTSRMYHGTR